MPYGKIFDAQAKQLFLARLRASKGNVSKACKAANISRNVAYDHRKRDADFNEAWQQTEAAIIDDAEQELYARGVSGWSEPVFYKGEIVGKIRKKSDKCLEIYLKGNRPEKYRERVDINANHAGSLDVGLQAAIDKAYGLANPDQASDDQINDDEQSSNGPAHAGAALNFGDDRDGS